MERVLVLRGDTECKGNDLRDMSIWTIHFDGNTKRFTEETHRFQTFLIVWTTSTDVDADLVVDQRRLVFFKGANDALEGRGDVGEVGNTTTGARRATSREID